MRALIVLLAISPELAAQTAEQHIQAGLHLQHAGHAAGALREFASAVKLAPESARTRLLLGTSLLDRGRRRTGDLFEALRQLRKAAELAPADGEYAYQLGRAYQRVSEWSVERMKAIDPHSARLYLVLGESYGAQGKTDWAIEALGKAVAKAPDMSGPHLALAFLYARSGKREQALHEVNLELAVSPDSAAAKAMKRQLESAP